MQKKLEKEFAGVLSKKYEGECGEERKQLYLSTPITALKCLEEWPSFNVVIIDEFHRVPTSKYYTNLLLNVINKDTIVLGFTALVPSRKLVRLHWKIRELIGDPCVLKYDFKDLSRYSDYVPPNAIADLYDAEFEENEREFYRRLITGVPSDDSRLIGCTPWPLITFIGMGWYRV